MSCIHVHCVHSMNKQCYYIRHPYLPKRLFHVLFWSLPSPFIGNGEVAFWSISDGSINIILIWPQYLFLVVVQGRGHHRWFSWRWLSEWRNNHSQQRWNLQSWYFLTLWSLNLYWFPVLTGGESVLLNYVQENPAEHVELKDVLDALGIKGAEGTTGSD